MSVIGNWSEEVIPIDYTIVYGGSGSLIDGLTIPTLDTPIKEIELLECRFNSATVMEFIRYQFKNKGTTVSGVIGSTIGTVYRPDQYDNTLYYNQYVTPLLLMSASSWNKPSKTSTYRLVLTDLNGTAYSSAREALGMPY
jgi:hypothetical protein